MFLSSVKKNNKIDTFNYLRQKLFTINYELSCARITSLDINLINLLIKIQR